MAAIVEGESPANPPKENSTSNEGSAMDGPSFTDQFKLFAKFGDSKSTGEAITLSNSDKWMKQAKVIDKKLTTTDTGIYYKMVAKAKKSLPIKEYEQFLETLAKNKKADVSEMKQKMASCGPPATSKTTSTAAAGAVSRLTDHTKYTGTHKLRFDDSGKGRGKEGRVDKPNTTGYVQGYKEQGTYETTH
ncbi:tubulin polymerization-promoting protein homolog [Uloborus diversus]|uniref:tubulin polymerization-promoting protein homolog n=1 Tax=Uloborus diversus TaxID=327109 RepID=UPI00240A61AA|nr:tubulin polymerization-promoting protein homolog [Uloborus diversus]